MVINFTDITVTLSWMEPDTTNGIITQYQLQYKICDQPILTGQQNITDLTLTVDGLVAGVEYCFRVGAFTRVGEGVFTSEVMATTCESHQELI